MRFRNENLGYFLLLFFVREILKCRVWIVFEFF